MPRPRRLARLRSSPLLEAPAWRHLCDLEEPGDRETRAWQHFVLLNDPMMRDEAWQRFAVEATAEHADRHPGHRPALWWRHEAPGAPHARRLQLAGQARYLEHGYTSYGLPWSLSADPADPPVFESQAAYLRRLGLLLPGERPPPAAFEPETVEPDPGAGSTAGRHG